MAGNGDTSDSPTNSTASDHQYNSVYGHGHFFVKKTFHKPTYCHHCTDILWGLIGVGYVCDVCNFVVHDRCMKTVVSPCSSIATSLIKNPVAHCWSEPSHFKRKFCNVCRKRLEDSLSIRCEICEYYAHLDCQDFVVSDCMECATYFPQRDRNVVHYHHWREGNLPPNSKCVACKKTCWSSECLAGMRCEWCGVTSHATCYRSLPVECKFGSLREILLPSSCLTIPRLDVPMETILGISRKSTFPPRTVSEEWFSSGDSKTDEDDRERRSPREKDGRDKDKEDCEIIRVFDGNTSLKKRLYRTISVPRNATVQAILEAALKTFHISDDPKNYYVTEATETSIGKRVVSNLQRCHSDSVPWSPSLPPTLRVPSQNTTSHVGGERELEENMPVRSQLKTPDGKRPAIFLRYKEKKDSAVMKVYPGGLRVSCGYKNIVVNKDTTTEEVILTSLRKFGVEDKDPESFDLIEVLLDKGVTERKVDRHAKPFQIIVQSRRVGVVVWE